MSRYGQIFDKTSARVVSDEPLCTALMYLSDVFIDFLYFLYCAAKH